MNENMSLSVALTVELIVIFIVALLVFAQYLQTHTHSTGVGGGDPTGREKENDSSVKDVTYNATRENPRETAIEENVTQEKCSTNKNYKNDNGFGAGSCKGHSQSIAKNKKREKNSEKNYSYLGVYEGKLATDRQKSYYRVWEEKGEVRYEFYCSDDLLQKAINNRSSLIKPFCDIAPKSVDPDNAHGLECKYGVLDKEFNIIKKAIVKYI